MWSMMFMMMYQWMWTEIDQSRNCQTQTQLLYWYILFCEETIIINNMQFLQYEYWSGPGSQSQCPRILMAVRTRVTCHVSSLPPATATPTPFPHSRPAHPAWTRHQFTIATSIKYGWRETYGSAKIMQQDIEKTRKNLLWYMDFQILLFQTP